ncbi:GNAT family N-acetyltransferase [Paenibacillus sp. 32352]|uniref:GNAT family N-acetyltransferase n=1 Tax=Paenibacillus sp. 32352 TaxID=1969111 RepID=UPI0009AE251E|nr:GNAT family N-acetyltransferase [Paenibacillus sp. 32352]
MKTRRFQASDMNQIVSLFYETVHSVNGRDYSQEQLDAWAPRDEQALKLKAWEASMSRNVTYVAEADGVITGFSDMTSEGHLDRLYVHKDYQRQGIASMLVDSLEEEARRLGLVEIDVEASITAKPFFEKRGYRVLESQVVERRGVKLANYKMIKSL